ncbi:MAG TPA: alpha/beta hydrolase [Gemmatimonadales bacterium]|nr:alpha/beta hydrolase [Gemmatimonadales bacterium]
MLLGASGCRARPLPESAVYPAGTPLATHYVMVNGTRLRYVATGKGPAVVFIHGFGASLYGWRKNLEPIANAGYRVVAFDNRGFGWSDKPAKGYTAEDYAALVLGLLDSLDLPDVVLVGHSMGGAVALETALLAPHRVRGLVLLDPAGFGTRWPFLLKVARWPLVGPLVTGMRNRWVVGRILRSTYADPSKVTDLDVDQYYAPVPDPSYGRSLRGVLREFRFDGLRGRLGAIEQPTLLLWGEKDRWIPLSVGRAMASELPRVAFVPIQGAGHATPEEAPLEVNNLIIAFLKEGVSKAPENLAWR